MKQLVSILLLFTYALAMSGMEIHAHYCGSTLVSLDIDSKGDACENVCKKPMKCCSDKVILLQLTNEQKTSQVYSVLLKGVITDAIPARHTIVPQPVYTSVDHITYQANAPPGLWQQRALYQLHSSLVYYG